MTGDGERILGTLGSAGGKGVVRIEDRIQIELDDVWSALTDPRRLGHWLGEVEGDLRPGGEFRARFVASGWEGAGRIAACEPGCRLLVRTRDAGEPERPDDHTIEVTLGVDGGRTIVAWEERGMPEHLLAAYGAGIQVHVEDLVAYLTGGRERREPADARWEALLPAYEALAAAAG